MHTGRQLPTVSSLDTQVTHLHHVFLRNKLGGTKRTGLDAQLTASAFLLGDENNAIGALINSTLRTSLKASWLATMLTGHRHKIHDQLAPNLGGPHLFNLDEVWPHAKPVLLLAGHLTGKTTVTEVYVNKK